MYFLSLAHQLEMDGLHDYPIRYLNLVSLLLHLKCQIHIICFGLIHDKVITCQMSWTTCVASRHIEYGGSKHVMPANEQVLAYEILHANQVYGLS